MTEILIKYKANPNALDKKNHAPIHIAAINDEYEIVEVLLRGYLRYILLSIVRFCSYNLCLIAIENFISLSMLISSRD